MATAHRLLLVATALILGALVALDAARQAGARSTAEQQRLLAAEDARAPTDAEVGVLVQGTRSRNPELQRFSVRALGRLERASLVAEISRLLAAPLPGVRAEAVNALGQAVASSTEAATEVRRRLLERLPLERDPAVRGVICETLGHLQHGHAEELREVERALLDASRRGPAPMRRSTVTARADVTASAAPPSGGDAAPLPALLGAAKGFEALARINARTFTLSPPAAERLRQLVTQPVTAPGGTPSDDYADAAVRIRRLALAALTAGHAAGAETLRAAARDPDAQVRRLAIAAIAATDPFDASLAALITFGLDDKAAMVRYEALRAYSRWLRSAGCAPIVHALDDPDAHVALLAIDALGDGCPAGDRVADTLDAITAGPLVPGPWPATWHRPAHALVSLAKVAPERATARLLRFGGAPTWQVRMYAARAAAVLGAAARLERLAEDANDNVREAAVSGLAEVARHDADAVYIAQLARGDYQLLRSAARALEGTANGGEALPALLAALAGLTAEHRDTSRDPRVAILERIGELGSPETVPRLQPYLADFDPRVAQLAADILTRWTGRSHTPVTTRPRRGATPVAAEIAALTGTTARVTMRGGGRFEMRLLTGDAPVTVARVVRLARQGYYNGLTFHRSVPNFVIQGGSPGANEFMGDGPYMRDELGLRSHLRGTVGISTRGRDTGDAQIFINLVDNPRLDHDYTVFAMVTAGMEVVDRVLEGDVIEGIEIVGGRQ